VRAKQNGEAGSRIRALRKKTGRALETRAASALFRQSQSAWRAVIRLRLRPPSNINDWTNPVRKWVLRFET
jgi:hypothetical protein